MIADSHDPADATASPDDADDPEPDLAGAAPGQPLANPPAALRSTVRWALAALVAMAPWTWFVFRDHLGELGDVAALGVPLVAGGLFVLAVLVTLWRRTLGWLGITASIAAWGAATVLGPWVPHATGAPVQPVRIVAANLRFDNETPDASIDAVEARRPDVVVLAEATARDVARARRDYPNVLVGYEPGPVGNTVLVASRLPLHADRDRWFDSRVVRVVVDAPGGSFVLYGVHLPRPDVHAGSDSGALVTFSAHRQLVEQLTDAAQQEDLPVVLAGDFNMGDRMPAYRTVDAAFVDAMRSGAWGSPTYRWGVRWDAFLLRIDHVFMSHDLCAAGPRHVDLPGSDHRGVEVNVGRCR